MYFRGKTFLNNERNIKILFPNTEGLIEASPLLLNGFKVGVVTKINLKKDTSGYLLVATFKLTKDIKIPKNSTANIISSDLLGTKAVDLIFSEQQNLIADNDTLIGFTEKGFKDKISDNIEPLKDKANNLISSFDTVAAIYKSFNKKSIQQNLTASIESIKKSINVLKRTVNNVDTLMGPDKSAFTAIMKNVDGIKSNLEKNKSTIDHLTKNVNELKSDEVKQKVTSVMDNTKTAINKADKLMTYLKSGNGTLAKAMQPDSVKMNLDDAKRDLDLLLKDLKANPDKYFHASIFAPKKKPVE